MAQRQNGKPQSTRSAKRPPRVFLGHAFLVAVFRELDPGFRRELFGKLQGASPLLARLVDEFYFVYQDLPRLDDASIQALWRLIPQGDWLLAWKLSDEATRQCLLRNLTERRRAEFMAAAQSQPRALRRQVVKIQARIAHQAQQLLEQGKLRLKSKRPQMAGSTKAS